MMLTSDLNYMGKSIYFKKSNPLQTNPFVCVLSHFSHVQLFLTLWTVAC